MKLLDKVDSKLVDAFAAALKGAAAFVVFVVVFIVWVGIIITAFKASVILGMVALMAALIFVLTCFNYFD